jgi:beta-lactamase superfamily II metal-dependent hydrolase
MARVMLAALIALLLIAAASGAAAQSRPLDIYFIDVEGGQATLFVAPSGESMLIDAGYATDNARDAGRIVAAASAAGLRQIDYLVVTHFHGDHIGGVPQLAERFPIRTFVDHGDSIESEDAAQQLFKASAAARRKARHLLVKPGDTIPIKDLDVRVVAARAALLKSPLPGAGAANPLCRDHVAKTPEQGPRLRPSTIGEPSSENFMSVATMIAHGSFRLADLGDLAWNQEAALVCPANLLGTADVYLTTAHGQMISGPPALVHGLRPRAIIMNNALNKGGDSPTLAVLKGAGADIWQLHTSKLPASPGENAAETFIANIGESDPGHWIKLSAQRDGSFVVTNGRTNFSKTYPATERRTD